MPIETSAEGAPSATPLVAEAEPQGACQRWLHKTLLRELPSHLRWAYAYFGMCLILLIGSQGFIFPVRTSVFYDIFENKYCPPDNHRCDAAAEKDAIAKTLLPVIQLPCVIGFNTLWGMYKNPRLMMVAVCSLFTAAFVPIYIGLIPMGIQKDINNEAYTQPELWLAFLTYYSVELKAVICPVMMWCVVNDLTPPKLAKIAYPPIVFAVQVGTVIGAFMAARVEWFGGNPGLVLIQIICLVLALLCGLRGLTVFQSGTMPDVYLPAPVRDAETANPPAVPAARDEQEGCLRAMWSGVEGLKLILSHPYLLCTAWCSVAHLVPRLFLDFQGTQVGKNWCAEHHPDNHDCKTSFFGWINFIQSILTMLLALVGTRKIVEYGGLRLSLSVLPIFAIVGNLATFTTIGWLGSPTSEGGMIPNVWITQISIIAMNTFGYGLNGPSREMLYVKTARNMKYKAKSWSDMYGNNAMKSLASAINAAYNSNGDANAPLTSSIATAWVIVWLGIVQWVGKKHKSLMDSGKVIGEEQEGLWSCLQNQDGEKVVD